MSYDFDTELDRAEKHNDALNGAKWAKFETIGDSVQGTYIDRHEAVSPSGQNQIVFVLKTAEGPVNVGRSTKDSRVHRVMDEAKYGQVVRFKYTELVPHKTKGFNAIKVIEAITRPDIVDKEWLAEQGATETITPGLTPSDSEAASAILDATDEPFKS